MLSSFVAFCKTYLGVQLFSINILLITISFYLAENI